MEGGRKGQEEKDLSMYVGGRKEDRDSTQRGEVVHTVHALTAAQWSTTLLSILVNNLGQQPQTMLRMSSSLPLQCTECT